MVIGWLGLGILAISFSIFDSVAGIEKSQLALSAVVVGFGTWVFWSHGRHQITAAGLFSLAVAVFVGFAGIWVNIDGGGDNINLLAAIIACFLSHVAIYIVFWSRAPRFDAISVPNPDVSLWGMWLGTAVTLIGIFLTQISGLDGTQVSLLGLTIALTSLVLHWPRPLNSVALGVRLVAAGIITAVAAVTIFSAFGRLMLVSLGMSVVLSASSLGFKRVKMWTIAALPLVLVALVDFRESAQREIGFEEDGIGSVVGPIQTFGQLIGGDLGSSGGNSIAASLLWWIPRSIWPEKPVGLGAAIAQVLEPEAAGRGHSMASTGFGEWFFYFGWLGVVGFAILFGFIVQRLDRWIARQTRQPLVGKKELLVWCGLIIVVSELPAIAWSGTFTYSTRTGMKLIALLFLASMLILWRGQRSQDFFPKRSADSSRRHRREKELFSHRL